MNHTHLETTDVLVVGGSLVGLSAALFLRSWGVPTVLVEPHLGSSPHPRAIGYTPRTMELLRSVGLADRIPQAPPGFRLSRRVVESLAGAWQEPTEWTPEQKPRPEANDSPMRGAAVAQDQMEPVLRDAARDRGADLRLGTRLARFEQDAAGVTATLQERASGREVALRAHYVIAADGAKSMVREALGVTRSGPGLLRTVRSVLFRAPLDEYLASGTHQFQIEQPGFSAFLTTYRDGRWVLMFSDDVERDEPQLRAAVQRAIGRDDVPIEILTTGRWELAGLVADRFSVGRVFLAGDSAHVLPPTRGGFGANTGIQDAHNLAWKLAAVLAGKATPALLATYHAERHPVAWTRLEQTFARPDYAKTGRGFAAGVPLFDDAALEFGQLARSAAVLGAGAELPAAATPTEWAGQPGTRAPHVAGPAGSTLDAFGKGWVLLTDGDAWTAAVSQANAQLGLGLTEIRGADYGAEAIRAAFGLSAGGASLVRPDGYVAWRTERPAPAPALCAALAQVACSPAEVRNQSPG